MANSKKNNNTDKKETKEFNPYMLGTEDIVREIFHWEAIKTLKEFDTDKESMYLYVKPQINKLTQELINSLTAGIYFRGEPEIKVIAEKTYKKRIEEMLDLCKKLMEDKYIDENTMDDLSKLWAQLNRKLQHDGITSHEITEVMQNLRRKTFVDRKTMNPDGFIPLKNGLLSLKDWTLHDFNASHFYTWKVNGVYDPSIRSLNQTPQFKKFLMESYPPRAIPTILDYMAYCLYPSFPRQKILVIAGPPRMGKGTIALLMERILNEGFYRISLMKLLIPENKFSLQGIEGKRLLVDTEIKREFKKNADFDVVNSLFGGDPLPLEKKYHQEITYIAKSAGLLIGNLPLFKVSNLAFLSRLLIVTTQAKRNFKVVTNIADRIFNEEGDAIVSLLLNRLRSLIQRDFKFSNELTDDEYAQLWEDLSDSTQIFMDERMVDKSGGSWDRDFVYQVYEEFCEERGIPPEGKHAFVYRVNKVYPKKKVRHGKKVTYEFQGCSILTEVDIEREEETLRKTKEKQDKEFDELMSDDFHVDDQP